VRPTGRLGIHRASRKHLGENLVQVAGMQAWRRRSRSWVRCQRLRDHHPQPARPPADRLPLSKYRVLPVAVVPAIFEDEEWFGAVCGCFGERDGFREAFEWERLALRDAQHSISDETANLG
jgi:hypothetical protein